MNSKRMNRLEELGRVDAEKADTSKGKRNLKNEKSRIVRELKAKGGKVKGKREKNPKHEQAERKSKIKKEYRDMGFGKMIDDGDFNFDKVSKMKSGGRALKPVPAGKKGLSKLPTKVRNKMGFMKKGGMVPNKKYIKKTAKELRKK